MATRQQAFKAAQAGGWWSVAGGRREKAGGRAGKNEPNVPIGTGSYACALLEKRTQRGNR
jgi:hypothetical protein